MGDTFIQLRSGLDGRLCRIPCLEALCGAPQQDFWRATLARAFTTERRLLALCASAVTVIGHPLTHFKSRVLFFPSLMPAKPPPSLFGTQPLSRRGRDRRAEDPIHPHHHPSIQGEDPLHSHKVWGSSHRALSSSSSS